MCMSDISRLYRSITMGKYTIQNMILLYNNLNSCLDVLECVRMDKTWNTFLSLDGIWKGCLKITERIQEEINLDYGTNSYDAMSDDIEGGVLYNRNMFKRGKYSDMDLYERGWIESVEKVHAMRDLFSNIIDELSSKKKKKSKAKTKTTKSKTTKTSNTNTTKQNSGKEAEGEGGNGTGDGMSVTSTSTTTTTTTTTTPSYCKIQTMDKTGYYLKATASRCEYLKTYFSDTSEMTIDYESLLDKEDKNFKIQMPITYNTITSSDKRIGNNQIETYLLNCRENREIFMNKQEALFENKMKVFIDTYGEQIVSIVDIVSTMDVIMGNAELAKERKYICPRIDDGCGKNNGTGKGNSPNQSYLQAKGMRHPLIEVIQTQEVYVSNDIVLGGNEDSESESEEKKESKTKHISKEKTNKDDNKKEGILLFGTNAVGKSSLIKAVGMNLILAQAGFFVPCDEFTYCPFYKIFTRILGNDNLFKGLSTFAVEMSELNTILRYSDERSLVLGDELCSGTEMGSAISIFVAGLLELERKRVKYMFATHLHEIVDMDLVKEMKNMSLKHLSVHYDRENDMLVYDRKLQDGSGSNLYGLEVCKALHLPNSFLEMANQIRIVRYPESKGVSKRRVSKYNRDKIKFNCEICKRDSSEVHHLEQQKYADKEGFIGSMHKDHQANLINVCHDCHDEIHKKKKVLKRRKTSKGVKLMELSDEKDKK